MSEENNPEQINKTVEPEISKIVVDRDLCIGAASCVAIAPGVFALDNENKAYVIDEKGADNETILLAAQSCPTRAILLYDKDGKQIYP
ncbi:ferredoxin [Candidatus Giovannonibacteria bacterium]|nr:ferredoxin [Candidatus Giovannonibacteria bacterium]